MARARSGGTGRADRVPAGAVPLAIFLPGRGCPPVRSGRAHSRSNHGGILAPRWRIRNRRHCLSFRTPGRRRLSQHRGRARRRWQPGGPVSQDAHPRRSALFREVLFHAGRSGLPHFRHALRENRRADLLGPVVSGSGASGGAGRRRRAFSIPPRSAGIPPRSSSTAQRSTTPGAPYSARTPSPTASTWPP